MKPTANVSQSTRICTRFDELPPPKAGCALSLGVWDGVHTGHQALLRLLMRTASQRELAPVLVTFERHPNCVLRPSAAPPCLTTLDERVELLLSFSPARLYVIPFTRELASTSAEDFYRIILRQWLNCALIVAGPDFAVGRRREGSVDRLRELGSDDGFEVEMAPKVVSQERVVSSTVIREAVTRGAVEIAHQMLGRPFVLTGARVAGRGQGRRIGFPTVNVVPDADKVRPANGVYGGIVTVGEQRFLGAMNIGERPTFKDGDQPSVEVHLIDYDGCFDHDRVAVELHCRIRAETRFQSVDDLRNQIQMDCNAIRDRLRGLIPTPPQPRP